jgi:voltage-gated potassium channel Kch
VLLAIGMLFYHYFEGWRYIDALYFSTTTLTTIGFGDFTPKTDIGKFFTVVYALTGIGVILTAINHFASTRLKSIEKKFIIE